jgi:hypothetical protein
MHDFFSFRIATELLPGTGLVRPQPGWHGHPPHQGSQQ